MRELFVVYPTNRSPIEPTRLPQSEEKAGAERISGADSVDDVNVVRGDLCVCRRSPPPADALTTLPGVPTPVGPGSTLAAVALVNAVKVRTAELLAEQGALPPVITSAAIVGEEESRRLFDAAYEEHARRVARVLRGAGVV